MKAPTASTILSWCSERCSPAGRLFFLSHCALLSALLSASMLVQGQGQGQDKEQESDAPFTRQSLDARSGQALAEKLWVAAPASTRASDGLGPYYNARSCTACHPRGGQGRPYAEADEPEGRSLALSAALVLHLSGDTRGVDDLGRQLQTAAVPGLRAEVVAARVSHAAEAMTLNGGETVRLSVPEYEVAPVGSTRPGLVLSPRLAPDLSGVALLDRIPDRVLRAHADPTDRDQDGISGRVGHTDGGAMGRFGWRAQARDLEDQVARAFALDMGLGSPLYPAAYGDCTASQTACRERAGADAGAHPEVSRTVLDLILAWLSSPAMQPSTPVEGRESGAGGQLFRDLGCAGCHTPTYSITLDDRAVLIHPYTDLLLHDMGTGLADQRVSGGAPLNSEWRTAPLWGLRERRYFLHDGRAHSPQQAILWHGGEAAGARSRYRSLPPEKRASLLNYLEKL